MGETGDPRVDAHSTIDIQIIGADQLATVARRLREAGRDDLRKALIAQLRAAAQPALADVKAAVMAVESKGVRGGGASQRARAIAERARDYHKGVRKAARTNTGLRASVAAAIEFKITTSGQQTGVRFRVNKDKLPIRQRTLPTLLNGGRWRHPVFGHDVWVGQTGSPYWDASLQPHVEAMRTAMLEAMSDAVSQIESDLK